MLMNITSGNAQQSTASNIGNHAEIVANNYTYKHIHTQPKHLTAIK